MSAALPPLKRLLTIAEALDDYVAAVAANRSSRTGELDAQVAVIREALQTHLATLESAVVDALAHLDGCATGDPDEWERTADRLRAALNPEEE